MFLAIDHVLDAESVARARALAHQARFVDGARSAGWHAKLVKANEQADAADPSTLALRSMVETALRSHELVRLAARPRRFGPVLISRSREGHGYGSHVDDALMGGIRSDLSFTLFLSDGFEGGELVIESTAGEQPVKLPPGSLVLYPSTTLHRVERVTAGERLVAAGWIESYVRDPGQRELLFDLDTARASLFRESGKTAQFDLLSKVSANLLRMWAET